MPDLTTWFLLLFVASTTLMMSLAVPLMRRRVPPNSVFGVRTPKKLDEAAWYDVNAYGGRLLFRTGLAQLVAVFALYCIPMLRADFVAYCTACGTIILGGIGLATALLISHLRAY